MKHLAGPMVALLVMLWPGAALAQGWIRFADEEAFFAVNFPGEPMVEDIAWLSDDDIDLPARQYTAARGDSLFKLIVVDYSDARITTMRGSIAHAATQFRQRGEVTYDAYAQIDRIEGHQLQIIEPNGRRLFVAIHLHEGRLYTLEASAPARAPPPGHFQQSLEILDDEGNRIRYTADGRRMMRVEDLPPEIADRVLRVEDGFVDPQEFPELARGG